jgi:DNA (cytosine-5)-methyltransferase 1
MRYGSLCSGIEAASAAWKPLGWECAYVSEIEPFPCAVLKHHYSGVPNLGDMTAITDEQLNAHPINLLVAGTPCQGFSVAGLRGGMADPRSQLAQEFLGIAGRAHAEWLVWENVPGVLSSWTDEATFAPSEESRSVLQADGLDPADFIEVDQTNDFDQFTSAIRERGYSLAWGILDAQYFGLAQRRQRVFIVASIGEWTGPAAVLFDRESLCGDSAPCRETGQRVAASLTRGADSSGAGGYAGRRREDDTNIIAANNFGERETATALSTKNERLDGDTETFVVHSLRADGFDASEDGTGRGTPIVPISFGWNKSSSQSLRVDEDTTDSLQSSPCSNPAVAFAQNQRNEVREMDVVGALAGEPGMKQQTYVSYTVTGTNKTNRIAFENDLAGAVRTNPPGAQENSSTTCVSNGMAVRRLTPRECERLQGFPDDFTAIPVRGKPAADGPRYRALGNSMAVPVMRWIGERIAKVIEAKKGEAPCL